ncbi:MAG: TonB-dependent receptor [Proteobacteria bacterium]|nr:TonB-dependent receptor [Pseudomonadota bacterium]MBU1056807.1 TonB-dependent receptor [Pseudomonadota bacterium]
MKTGPLLKKMHIQLLVLSHITVTCFFLTTTFPSPVDATNLGVLSLDELLDLEVISVTKVPEKITDTPAAIYIITQEDLRRNGVKSVPEALRMVPGLHVYQIDANKWAVSARGYASRFANKMLVMIDGRTVYSTLFSGVFWDVQDVMLEDIDRIEVVRGPGGTLWGANAVNGVINIISKDSADTQGGLVSLAAGTSDSGEISTRYGGWLNDRISYRLYSKYFNRGNYETPADEDAADEWHAARGGFRMDMNLTASNKVTLQGDLYEGESGESVQYVSPFPPYKNITSTDAPVSGGNMLGRWIRTFSKDSEITIQAYYDHIKRNEFFVDETLDTLDLDFQHHLDLISGLEILWGMGYRYTKGNTTGKEAIPGIYSYNLDPQIREDSLFSGFLEGRIAIADGKGEFTLGTKLEHNDYTGFEWQPSSRIMWNLNADHSLWGAISRSVRTPSRLEHDADINAGAFFLPTQQGGLLTFIRLNGNEETESETVFSYETGYRARLNDNIFFDLSIYYNKYKNLITAVPMGAPFPEYSSTETRRFILPLQIDNGMDGETYGAEISCRWSITDWWRLTGGFTWFHFNAQNMGNSQEARRGFEEDQNANFLFSLLSYMDLPGNFDVNTALYGVDSLDELNIDSYLRFDLNIGWHPTEHMTLSAGGHNLLNNSHQEFSDTMDGILASTISQTFYTKLTITF